MLYKILLSLAVASLPAMAHAQIYSNTSATSNTGGNVVGQGGSVTTGDASASVQVSNTQSQGTSSSSVYIKTDANGAVHEETYTSDKSNTSVKVMATPAKTTIDITEGNPPTVVKHEVVTAGGSNGAEASGTAAQAATTSGSGEEPSPGLGTQIVLAVQGFFATILGWFR